MDTQRHFLVEPFYLLWASKLACIFYILLVILCIGLLQFTTSLPQPRAELIFQYTVVITLNIGYVAFVLSLYVKKLDTQTQTWPKLLIGGLKYAAIWGLITFIVLAGSYLIEQFYPPDPDIYDSYIVNSFPVFPFWLYTPNHLISAMLLYVPLGIWLAAHFLSDTRPIAAKSTTALKSIVPIFVQAITGTIAVILVCFPIFWLVFELIETFCEDPTLVDTLNEVAINTISLIGGLYLEALYVASSVKIYKRHLKSH